MLPPSNRPPLPPTDATMYLSVVLDPSRSAPDYRSTRKSPRLRAGSPPARGLRTACGCFVVYGVHMAMAEADTVRFLSKFDTGPAEACWPWRRSANDAHCQFWVHGRSVGAHRMAYEYYVGSIPDGMWVLHHCDNPPCMNPAHLFLGTAADNSRDMVEKGRQCFGERNAHARLSDDDVRDVLISQKSSRSIAREYGVSKATIQRVRLRETWSHIGGESVVPPGVARGERHCRAKLTEAAVLDIRSNPATGAAMARHYGVNEMAISQIRNRKTWKHIPPQTTEVD